MILALRNSSFVDWVLSRVCFLRVAFRLLCKFSRSEVHQDLEIIGRLSEHDLVAALYIVSERSLIARSISCGEAR